MLSVESIVFCFLQRAQCSHCKRCISCGNSVRPPVCLSVCHTPVRVYMPTVRIQLIGRHFFCHDTSDVDSHNIVVFREFTSLASATYIIYFIRLYLSFITTVMHLCLPTLPSYNAHYIQARPIWSNAGPHIRNFLR